MCVHTDDEVDKMIDLLLNTKLSLTEIANVCNCNRGYIKRLNKGIFRKKDYLSYPLRQKELLLTERQVQEIITLILEGKMTQKEIAKLYGVARSTITNINNGSNFYIREGYDYPLRSKKVVR